MRKDRLELAIEDSEEESSGSGLRLRGEKKHHRSVELRDSHSCQVWCGGEGGAEGWGLGEGRAV